MSYYFTNQYTSKQNSIKNLLNDLFSYTEENDMPVQANIISKEKEILIQMQTPGIPKEDINIDFNSNYLVVTYEASKEESIEGTYTQQQIFTESFKNTFKLSGDLDSNKISASMNNGILNISIPRKKEKSKTRIKITWQTIVFDL